MNVSRPFILRPVATSLLMLALLLAGIIAYRQLPVSALPQVDYPTMQVMTFYPGANPDVMASSVTAPLERQFGQVPGLNQMTSVSSEGSSVITLQFALDLNIDIAEQQVQQAINAAANFLPADLPNPPVYSKTNPADTPVLTLALSSTGVPLTKIYDLADTRIAQKIAQIPGVGLVTVTGGKKPAVRIRTNPLALASYGIGSEDVRTAIAAANVNRAKGSFDGPRLSHTINTNDQLLSAEEYRALIVAYRAGAPVRLADVAEIADDAENVRQAAWAGTADGLKPAVVLNIQRQPGANIIKVVDRIKELLPQLRAALPATIHTEILTDRTTTIRASVEDVQIELMLTVVLVVTVIFIFLRNISATSIPAVAVPLSIVGTFSAMYFLGFSLNNLTLMALTISAGFVVDDAIVMIENIIRHIEEGMPPHEAALKGSGEIGFTIVSLSVSLIAALIPLLFMGDIVGRLFREFAVTLSITIVVSAIVSLTLTPVMCAFFLKDPKTAKRTGGIGSKLFHLSERGWEAIVKVYEKTLTVVLRHQRITLFVAISTFALTGWLFLIMPKGFFPVQDTGLILGISETAQNASFTAISEKQEALMREILKDPGVESLTSFIGVDGTNPTVNTGRIQINLKPNEERKIAATGIIDRLRPTLEKISGITLHMQPVQDLTVEDRISKTQFQYTLEDPSADVLSRYVPEFIAKLNAIPGIRDVASDHAENGLSANVIINRDTASRLGLTPQVIDDTLYNAFGQRQVSTIFTELNQYRVVLEAAPAFARTPADLKKIYFKTPAGGIVPLDSFASVTEAPARLTINHQGQFPVTTISFNLAPHTSLGDVVDKVDAAQKSLGMPASTSATFQGTARAFRASLANEIYLIAAALVTVYIVLGVLYESYIHPLTILSTLPSAGIGAFLALLLCSRDFDIIALIGIILLIGIVMKNAIMMIDFALAAQRNQGKTPEEAIFQACLLRFRPILMTTAAALFGAVPLAIGGGVGSELRSPLGITIIGGLIFSQMLTLYTTPVIYLWFDKIARLRKSDAAA